MEAANDKPVPMSLEQTEKVSKGKDQMVTKTILSLNFH